MSCVMAAVVVVMYLSSIAHAAHDGASGGPWPVSGASEDAVASSEASMFGTDDPSSIDGEVSSGTNGVCSPIVSSAWGGDDPSRPKSPVPLSAPEVAIGGWLSAAAAFGASPGSAA